MNCADCDACIVTQIVEAVSYCKLGHSATCTVGVAEVGLDAIQNSDVPGWKILYLSHLEQF